MEEFKKIFTRACYSAVEMRIPVTKPRTAARSIYRPNAAADESAETYYRANMFAPLLDGLLAHLRDRFGPTQEKCLALSYLIPSHIGSLADLEPALEIYDTFLESRIIVEQEIKRWHSRWAMDLCTFDIRTALSALEKCCPITLPNVHKLLSILATIPVTTAEAERVFSKVQRTASAVRASMGEDRLCSLIMLESHRDRQLQPLEVITRFASISARRLNLLL